MINEVHLINLATHPDRRGVISVLEDLPFVAKRIFNIYNVPLNEMRGGHAHKKCKQLFIATCGAVLIKVAGHQDYVLDCPDTALYVPPKHLVYMMFLNDNSVLTVLASERYDSHDYIYGTN